MPITTTGSIVYFKDDLGQPLIGGKVYTYEYSTSKPKDTYKTAVRELPHTNPVILNDSGSVEWYLKGDYTIRVYTSEDVFVEEFDIVTPSKVQVDEVSDSLNLLKSELKNAAYRDTGTDGAQVPLNSDLGTAAYKNVGAEADNVMQVGAFGLGVSGNVTPAANTALRPLSGFGVIYGVSAEDTSAIPSFQHTITTSWSDVSGGVQLLLGLIGDKKFGYRNWDSSTGKWGSYIAVRTSVNTSIDANGFLRDSNSIAETVAADATGNVAVASIQAGIGAPKIAYKKFVLPSGTPTVVHGLNRDKILNISGVYVSGVERYSYAGAKVNATILDAAPTSIFERHILITYEV